MVSNNKEAGESETADSVRDGVGILLGPVQSKSPMGIEQRPDALALASTEIDPLRAISSRFSVLQTPNSQLWVE